SEAMEGRYRFGWSEVVSLIDGRHQYIKAPGEELYDLERDPGEASNLLDANATAALALRTALADLTADAKTAAPAPIAADDRDVLRALGYARTRGAELPFRDRDDAARPSPKDGIETAEAYRAAVALAADHKWARAIGLLQTIVQADPDNAAAWEQLAAFAAVLDRQEQAFDAWSHLSALDPSWPD